MAWVGHFAPGIDHLVLRRAGRVDDEGDRVVVEVEGAGRPEDAVPGSHARVPVDLDFEPTW